MSDTEEILALADTLEKIPGKLDRAANDKLEEAALRAAKSWCGSWIGYHSRVYYRNFEPVPPGARFSVEWGFGDRLPAVSEFVTSKQGFITLHGRGGGPGGGSP